MQVAPRALCSVSARGIMDEAARVPRAARVGRALPGPGRSCQVAGGCVTLRAVVISGVQPGDASRQQKRLSRSKRGGRFCFGYCQMEKGGRAKSYRLLKKAHSCRIQQNLAHNKPVEPHSN